LNARDSIVMRFDLSEAHSRVALMHFAHTSSVAPQITSAELHQTLIFRSRLMLFSAHHWHDRPSKR